ncbi:hypothetical protein ACWGH4_20600 [Streptomyces sp. NPDC054847]
MTSRRAPRPRLALSALRTRHARTAYQRALDHHRLGSAPLQLLAVLGADIAFGSLAWLTGNLTNAPLGTGPLAPFKATDALLRPDALYPRLSPTLMVGARIERRGELVLLLTQMRVEEGDHSTP